MHDLLSQIDSLPGLVRDDFARIDASVGACLAGFDAHSIQHLYITGCGDSYFAGLGTKLAISTWSGLRVSVASSLPAGRYDLPLEADHASESLLVLGVSRSGMVSRTIEAIRIANQVGANTVAVTATPESKLAQEADGMINGAVEDYPGAPNLRSYHVSLLALYAVGLHVGVIKGRLTQAQADQQRREINAAADVMEATVADNKPKTAALADALKDEDVFHYLGHGPNTSSAMFSAAKIVECVGRYAVSQDTEEWAHYEYFNTVKPDMPTFVISPGCRTHQLAAEFTHQMKRIGRTSIAVTPESDRVVAPLAVHHLPVVGEVSEILSPLVYALAGTLFGAHLLGATEAVPFRRDRAEYTTSVDHRVTEVLNLSDLALEGD